MHGRTRSLSSRAKPALLALATLAAVPLHLGAGSLSNPELLADLRNIPDSNAFQESNPKEFTDFGGFVFLTARDPLHGEELWRTDGTEEGTELWVDICPGPCDSTPNTLSVVGSSLYFYANDGVHGWELWRTDGSREQTHMVLDVDAVNSGSSFIVPFRGGMIVPGPYWTDGTAANTFLLGGPGEVMECVAVGGIAFFSARFFQFPGVSEGELFASHGEPGDIYLVKDLFPTGSIDRPSGLVRCADRVCFIAGRNLWSSDGTEHGTIPIYTEHHVSTSYGRIAQVGDEVVFSTDVYNSLKNGRLADLMRTDGTLEGTRLVTTLPKDSDASHPPELLTPVSGGIAFRHAADGDGWRLWFSDLTGAGTVPISEILYPSLMWPYRGGLLFAISDMGGERDLWYSTGLPGGAGFLHAVSPSMVRETSLGAFFRGDEAGDSELWLTDGTPAGTVLVDDIVPMVVDGSAPAGFTRVGQFLLFHAAEGDYSASYLWAVDDTFEDVWQPTLDGEPVRTWSPWTPVELDGRLIFTGWSTQSSAPNPAVFRPSSGNVAELAELTATGQKTQPREYTVNGEKVYFSANTHDFGRELWVTDGTSGGTALVADIYPGTFSANVRNLVAFGSDLYFSAERYPEQGVWRLEGGTTTPVLVIPVEPYLDVKPVAGFSSGLAVASRVNDQYWCGSDEILCWELGLWDPTTGSYSPLYSDYSDDHPGEHVAEALVLGETLIFTTTDNGERVRLWRSDGTEQGTSTLTIRADDRDSSVRELMAYQGVVYFSADDGIHGQELWATDGTQQGTALVVDLNPGPDSSYPSSISAAENVLMFAAWEQTSGLELVYGSIGSLDGWQRIDILNGPQSSNPTGFTHWGDSIVFAASDPVRGAELWQVTFNQPPPVLVFESGFESGSTSGWSVAFP